MLAPLHAEAISPVSRSHLESLKSGSAGLLRRPGPRARRPQPGRVRRVHSHRDAEVGAGRAEGRHPEAITGVQNGQRPFVFHVLPRQLPLVRRVREHDRLGALWRFGIRRAAQDRQLLQDKAPEDDDAWFDACAKVADGVRGTPRSSRAAARFFAAHAFCGRAIYQMASASARLNTSGAAIFKSGVQASPLRELPSQHRARRGAIEGGSLPGILPAQT